MTPLRIVLAGGVASYPKGGGHWSVFLQYLFGLKALGHDVYWFDKWRSTGDPARDERMIALFFRRFRHYGLADRAAVLVHDEDADELPLSSFRVHGMSRERLEGVARSADVLWNFCGGLRQPLLSLFRRRVLIDLDPGLFQVCALTWDMGIRDHEAFFTVGSNLHQPDCEVPTLGVTWRPFFPPVYLPMWTAAPDPGERAPFSSITEWTWHTVKLGDRLLSASKRTAYLGYIDLPRRCGGPFELAANIHAADPTPDRDELTGHGWRLVDPHRVAGSPAAYRRYVRRSRSEIACSKPIYRELKTGWFSDRSACYLASGRPVLAGDTGFRGRLPTGKGLLAFRTMEEAVAGAAEITTDYPEHMRAARELAEEFFESRRCLTAMVAGSG